MTSFRWLHLSDLHQGMSGQACLWPNVRQALYDDLERGHQLCGPLDAVFFTGDITQRGSKEEFAEANVTLHDLRTHIHNLGSNPVFLPVPGNHDLVRPSAKEPAVKLMANWDSDQDVSQEFWNDPQSPYRQVVGRAFANYLDWLDTSRLPRPTNYRSGLLPGDFVTTLEKESLRLGIVGLNSAFLQLTGANHKGKLALGFQQILDACDGDPPGWARKHNLCILLTHHGTDWLNPPSQQLLRGEMAPPGRFAIHLFGHMHEGRTETLQVSGASECRSWQGYSLFGVDGGGPVKEERRHGYVVGCIEFQKESASVRYWPRAAKKHAQGHWRIVPDHDTFDLTEDNCTRPEGISLQRALIASNVIPERTPEGPSPSAAGAQPDSDSDRTQHRLPHEHSGTSSIGSYRPLKMPLDHTKPPLRVPDEQTRTLLGRLDAARKRQKEFEDKGFETKGVRDEILELRRQLRGGAQLKAGYDLGDRYTLIRQLGQGGYGIVWDVYDQRMNARLAVKVLHPNVAGDVIKRDRFFRGATRMAALEHPAVVKILEKCAEDDGFFYYAMKQYTGGDLGDAIRHGGLSEDQIVRIIIRIADALGAAHARQWVHRDVKPANILLDENGESYLGDFELIAANDTTGGTRADEVLGTFLFSAPETMERPQDVDARADVYSLGMTLLYCLKDGSLKRAVIANAEPAIRSLSCKDSIKQVLKRSLRQKASDRYADSGAFRDALENALRSDNVAVHVSVVRRADTPGRTRTSKSASIELVRIPGGLFHMGADDDKGGRGWEHPVTLSSYEFSVHPISCRIYHSVLGERARRKEADFPVEITWIDALKFCNALSEQEGLEPPYAIDEAGLLRTLSGDAFRWHCNADGYRLPTEAEWEFAARGFDGRIFPWGNNEPTTQLHWSGYGGTRNGPSPIDQCPRGISAFGIHDMSGNTWEWCWDSHGSRYHGTAPIIADPAGPIHGGHQRIVRGGDWGVDQPEMVRATFRRSENITARASLRVARSLRMT